jgi:hypothetical protein
LAFTHVRARDAALSRTDLFQDFRGGEGRLNLWRSDVSVHQKVGCALAVLMPDGTREEVNCRVDRTTISPSVELAECSFTAFAQAVNRGTGRQHGYRQCFSWQGRSFGFRQSVQDFRSSREAVPRQEAEAQLLTRTMASRYNSNSTSRPLINFGRAAVSLHPCSSAQETSCPVRVSFLNLIEPTYHLSRDFFNSRANQRIERRRKSARV